MTTDAIQQTPVPCPNCGRADGVPVVAGYDRLLGHPGSFTLCCCGCGALYLNPRPADMMRYYQGDYLPHMSGRPTWLATLRRRLPRRPSLRARVLTNRAGGTGRLLDLGCAGGDFMHEMATLGWSVSGVEPGAAAIAASQRFPGRVVHGTLEQAGYADGSFDLVTLWDVVEHLPDPPATLREVWRLLRPGGLLFIQTPGWGCVESRMLGPYWAGLECPRHLCIFSAATLGRALERAGFQSQSIRPLVSSHWVWILSCRFWVQERFGPQAAAASYWLLGQRPCRLLFSPFFTTLDRLGLGSLLAVVAVRPSS